MAERQNLLAIESLRKSGILAQFGHIIDHFGHILCDMDFKFVSPIICIDIDGQTSLKLNQTQISHFIP